MISLQTIFEGCERDRRMMWLLRAGAFWRQLKNKQEQSDDKVTWQLIAYLFYLYNIYFIYN
jgi:hypothetical protein